MGWKILSRRIQCNLICVGVWCQGFHIEAWERSNVLYQSQHTGHQLNWIHHLIPAHTLPYKYINSYKISFENIHMYFQTCGWGDGSTHVWLPLWCVMRLATHVDLTNLSQDLKVRFNCKSNLTSVISNFSESGDLARYISRHSTMDYDTCPHKWGYQTWKWCKKNWYEKN